MNSQDCVDATCLFSGACKATAGSLGGPRSLAVQYAEALVGCTNACCGRDCGPVQWTTCGNQACLAKEGSQGTLWACCAPPEMTACGLDVFNLAGYPACVGLNSPGALDTSCGSLSDPGYPYPAGTELPGCCLPDGTCGYSDTATLKLGCVAPKIFGKTTSQSCGSRDTTKTG